MDKTKSREKMNFKLRFNSSVQILSLGKNPIRGGIPPILNKLRKIISE